MQGFLLTLFSFHIPIFASFITLSAGVLWFIHDVAGTATEGAEDTQLTEDQDAVDRVRALWDVGVSISVILFGYTGLALMDKPLDPPKATLVSNRYVRLMARPIYVIVILSIVSVDDMTAYLYFPICGVGMSLLLLHEMVGSMERPAGFFEPKGLTVLMKKEYRRGADNAGANDVRIAI